ncbi:hypothetical protein K443DRAFT_108417, partial [Laccaria amethystina LaAM-08-1]
YQESSPLTAEFGRIWVLTCGRGGCGRMGRSGSLLAGGASVFAVIWGSLVGRCGYAPGCRVGVGGTAVLFDVARGGPVLVGFEASQRGARWEEHPGFALVGGLLANTGWELT